MKIRMGFVSNSSSSSFIVCFPNIPQSVQDVKELLFPNDEKYIQPYDYAASTQDIAEQVFNDIQEQLNELPYNEEYILEEIANGSFEGYPFGAWDAWFEKNREIDAKYQHKYGKNALMQNHLDWENEWREELNKFSQKRDKLLNEAAQKYWNDNKEDMQNGVLLKFHYSDNSGDFFTVMEHGEIFYRLPYIRISHH